VKLPAYKAGLAGHLPVKHSQPLPANPLFAFVFFLCLIKIQKSAWGKNLIALTQFRWKIRSISGHKTYRLSGKSDFQEWFAIRIRKGLTEREGSH